MNGVKETFEIKETFYVNNEPIQLISGSFHYFRTVKEYWYDRLLKLKAMGCNCVETYVPWNLSNPEKDVYDFSGNLDLRSFVELAEELELYFILRPGPYICAEWEFGGHPAWLLTEKDIEFRKNNETYLRYTERYFSKLLEQVVDKQITHGGNIIMMQIENEYGYYGEDKEYLKALRNIMSNNGVNVPFITSDGPWREAYKKGSLQNNLALPTFNFGSGVAEHFDTVKEYLGKRPFMCMEFWIGWFDHWGGRHAHREPENVAEELDQLLQRGHVNFYMFQGGTNFGFMNGANDGEHHNDMKQRTLQPDVTSYDYDALLSEAGDITPKYLACQKVISKYREIPSIEVHNTIKKAYGKVTVDNQVSLFNVLDLISKPHIMKSPVSMEYLQQQYGYILYRTSTTLHGPTTIDLVGAADRVHYFIDEQLDDIRYDGSIPTLKTIDLKNSATQLDFLVENMGRVNFGYNMNAQQKGIRGPILLQGEIHQGVEVFPLGMSNLDTLDFSREYVANTPSFSRFYLTIDEPHDTFLQLDGFHKGFVIINGFNIGRYYHVGPQKTLYVPGPILKAGKNEIIVFESDGTVSQTIEFLDHNKLG